jgi:redox-sensitive bicupin YhaK (pirin superfamily)
VVLPGSLRARRCQHRTRHGLQLWIALPERDRFTEPRFAHHAELPVVREGGARVTVVIGEHAGERSPAEAFTPLAGLEVAVPGGDDFVLPVRSAKGDETRVSSPL